MKKNTAHTPLAAGLGFALVALLATASGQAQTPAVTKGVTTSRPAPAGSAPARVPSGIDFSTVGPSMDLIIGKSTLLRLPSPAERISLGDPSIADVTLISPTELYLLGKTYGSTNMIIWRKGSGATAVDLNVNIDYQRMERKINELMPEEKGIKVRPAADSVILTGVVSSAVKARYAEDIANAFVRDVNRSMALPVVAGSTRVAPGTSIGGGRGGAGGAAGGKVVNLLQIAEAQQVMLEVTVAEVSKTLIDRLGARFSASRTNGNWTFGILSELLSGGSGLLSAIKSTNGNGIAIDAEKNDGLVKVLAEPNIVAISGQEASFLAGGKIFIPVARSNETTGGTTITLEEKEFGVGVKFTPTVLEGGRIHLKVAPEVSELSQTGSPFTTVGGVTSVLPSFTTRKVQTSVQLMDGQSLAIAGLIKNNVKQAVERVPGLGEVPVLGALFRSNEFQGDRSELMFVITPRLVKPLEPNYILPTDSYMPPNRSEFYLGNKLEGSGHEEIPADKRNAPVTPAAAPAAGGMEVK
ncbi:type II and III secretion system protein family protein [Ramlibacter sp. 2FC]|uniref:type II and III secretion system protein family protein n=1 Tax=Ramlibacter sp. 2FC TaxID=2502188 RepID=UPI0010F600AD|nr:type II and III secretion system protein family protein [Ramlibacter sp. 2FC]